MCNSNIYDPLLSFRVIRHNVSFAYPNTTPKEWDIVKHAIFYIFVVLEAITTNEVKRELPLLL